MHIDRSREFALFIEKMRFLRGISQEEFTDGIISNRQYQRYVRGDSPMPYHLIDRFSERLNIKKEYLFLEFESASAIETDLVTDFMNQIINQNFDLAQTIRSKINEDFIMDYNNQQFFKFSLYLNDYFHAKIDRATFKSHLTKLVDYPKILESEVFSFPELQVLTTLLDYVSDHEIARILQKLNSFLERPNLVLTGNQVVSIHGILFSLARFHGMQGRFNDVIKYCNIGITINVENSGIECSDYYYYYLSLAYYKLGNITKFQEKLYMLYHVLIVINRPENAKKFMHLVEKDFNVDLIKFVIDYLNKKA